MSKEGDYPLVITRGKKDEELAVRTKTCYKGGKERISTERRTADSLRALCSVGRSMSTLFRCRTNGGKESCQKGFSGTIRSVHDEHQVQGS